MSEMRWRRRGVRRTRREKNRTSKGELYVR